MFSCIMISIQLISDFIQITFRDKYMEGYGYGIYVLLFDISIILPLILLMFTKDKFLIIWSILTVISLNLTIGFGWQWGSLLGVIFTVISIITFFINKKDLVIK